MTKEDIKLSVKRVFTDRAFLFLIASIIIVGLIYVLIIGLNIRSSDVTVYSRYTAFGEAHFYKSKWFYHLNFVAFGFIVVFSHIALMVKMHNLDRRQTALFIGFTALAILFVAGAYAVAVLQLGRGI
jgi:hypothetical protein